MAFENQIYSHNGPGYLNTQNDPAVTDFASMAGYALGGAAGNIAGTTLGYYLGKNQYKQQRADQKRMMKEQHKLQMEQQFMAPQLQKLGMEAAGMNPADGQYTQATPQVPMPQVPTPQTSHLSNIFDGLAEIIQAAKSNSEVEKNVAETAKTSAETNRIINITPKDIEKIETDIGKAKEETRGLKKENDWKDSADKFAKEQTQAVFKALQAKMEANGEWDKLPEDTKLSIDDFASGNITLDKAQTEQFFKTIELQKYMTAADAEMAENCVKFAVARKQLGDNKILDKMANEPAAIVDKIIADTNVSREQRLKLIEETKKIGKEIEEIPERIKKLQKEQTLLEKQANTEEQRKKLVENSAINEYYNYLEKKLNDYQIMLHEGNYTAIGSKLAQDGVGEVLSWIKMMKGARNATKYGTVTTTTKDPKTNTTVTTTRQAPVKAFGANAVEK